MSNKREKEQDLLQQNPARICLAFHLRAPLSLNGSLEGKGRPVQAVVEGRFPSIREISPLSIIHVAHSLRSPHRHTATPSALIASKGEVTLV